MRNAANATKHRYSGMQKQPTRQRKSILCCEVVPERSDHLLASYTQYLSSKSDSHLGITETRTLERSRWRLVFPRAAVAC